MRSGEEAKLTLKKLIKCLDKGREVPVQEAVFRACGLPLTKFSSIVKFINTNHPDRREGLLKGAQEVEKLGVSFCISFLHYLLMLNFRARRECLSYIPS